MTRSAHRGPLESTGVLSGAGPGNRRRGAEDPAASGSGEVARASLVGSSFADR